MTYSADLRRLSSAHVSVGLLVILLSSPFAALAATYGGGAGSSHDPFLITTVEEFTTLGISPADWDKHFKLVNDLDLSGHDEKSFSMIGRWDAPGSVKNQPFRGSFDGNGKTISGFRYKDMKLDYVGLFQHVTGRITNLHVARAKVVGNGIGAGALVGYLEGGFLIGCSATDVSVYGNVGVGALVGSVKAGLSGCWSNGRVTGARYVGGLVGWLTGGSAAHSYSKATVVGNETAGGFVGMVSGEFASVDSCYARGPVDGGQYVGGLAGQVTSGVIFRSYAAGKVTAKQAGGGLTGYKGGFADVLGCVWDVETTGQSTGVAGTGKTTAEMKSMDTYLLQNWDFATTWTICEGVGYPVLLWQIPFGDLRCPDGVNFTDFVWFAASWRHDDCGAWNWFCDGADLDESGEVDSRDLALFAANWLAGVD